MGHDPVNSNSNQRGEMNASLIILRDGADLRSSVAAATPSQLRRSRAARSISSVADATRRMSAAALRAHHERSTGQGSPSKLIEQPVGRICHHFGKNKKKHWTSSNLVFSELIFLPSIKSLGHSPDRKKRFFGGGQKELCLGSDPQN